MSEITPETWSKAVKALSRLSINPNCSNHRPRAEHIWMQDESDPKDEGGVIVRISCPTCGLLGWMHPQAYEDVRNGGPVNEVIDILKTESGK